MKFGNSSDEGETKPASRRGAAGFEAVKAAEDLCVFLGWDARAVVGDGCYDFVPPPFSA